MEIKAFEDLDKSPLITVVLAASQDVLIHVIQGKPIDNFPSELTYSYEILKVWHETKKWLLQLELIPVYLETVKLPLFNQSIEHDFLTYHLENYVIRLNSVCDRTYQMIDAVFNLGNSPKYRKRDIILSNRLVSRSGVSKSVAKLESVIKSCEKKLKSRNQIVHQESHSDIFIEKIEALNLMQRLKPEFHNEFPLPLIAEEKEKAISFYVEFRSKDIKELNEMLLKALEALFSDLKEIFDAEYLALSVNPL